MTDSNLLSADSHFAFGKNWLEYAQKIDEARIDQAVADLQRLAGRERFDGLSFLDIGCGSGLHALAAVRMGALRVVGVDIDADSVAASRGTLARFAPDSDARFEVVSVFDMSPETHGGFDVVYSWGVLHHTGDMYRALAVAASLVGGGGYAHGGFVQEDAVLRHVATHQTLVLAHHAKRPEAGHAFAHMAGAVGLERVEAAVRRESAKLRQSAWHGLLQRRARLDGRLSLRIDQPEGLPCFFCQTRVPCRARVRQDSGALPSGVAGIGLRRVHVRALA